MFRLSVLNSWQYEFIANLVQEYIQFISLFIEQTGGYFSIPIRLHGFLWLGVIYDLWTSSPSTEPIASPSPMP